MKHSQAGKTPGPVLAFLAILVIGILVTLFLFKDRIQEKLAEIQEPEVIEQPQVAETEAPAPAMEPPKPASPGSEFTTDAVLADTLLAKLKDNDIEGFLTLLGEHGVPAEEQARIRTLIVEQKFTLDPKNPLVAANSNGSIKRYALNLVPPADMSSLGTRQVELDLEPVPGGGWKIAKASAPDIKKDIEAMAASRNNPKDPLFVAREFADAVISLNFQKAKQFADAAKLSEEKLAALFIVVEQGAYKLRDEKPLTLQVEQKQVAWIIANLNSKAQTSQFGIEMERANEGSPWQVIGLNFDQMMQTVAMDAGAGGVAYEPYKANPQAGDQLVLYFEFDRDELNPRATKQLEVIANILKADAKRVLNINGYTDALGEDKYNERLSGQRAFNVRDALIAMGVKPEQVVTKALGESSPKAANFNPDGTDNSSGRAQNRRAEVYLQF